jgi:hypothetical protein
MTLPIYNTGTVGVSNGGTTVTGVGTIWSGVNVREGDYFARTDGVAVVTGVTDTGHITITPWPGATVASGGAYTIHQNYVGRVVGVAAAEDVATLITMLGTAAYLTGDQTLSGKQTFSNTTEATGAGTTAAVLFAGGVEIAKKLFVTGGLGVVGTSNFASLTSSGNQQLSVAPTGNGTTSLSSLNVQGTTISSTMREFLVNFGLNSTLGKTASGTARDKVLLYAGIDARTNSGDAWAANFLLNLDSTLTSKIAGNGLEIDVNNGSSYTYSDLGITVNGLSISGNAGNTRSAAIIINGPGSHIWEFGIVQTGTSINAYGFYEDHNSTNGIYLNGTHSGYAIYTAATAGAVSFGSTLAVAGTINGVTLDNAAWTAYTPTITPQGGTFTGATITATARYKKIGKTVIYQADVLLTALGSGSPGGGLRISLPFTAAAFNFAGTSREILLTGKAGSANVIASGTTLDARDATAATYIAAGNQIIVFVTYEVP